MHVYSHGEKPFRMLEYTTGLISKIEKYVKDLLSSQLDETRYFHGLEHTLHVVENCRRIAFLESCTEADTELLLAAAWFHDTGYVNGKKDHEYESFRIARQFLQSFKIADDFLPGLRDLIFATRIPTAPCNLLQEIICDADMSHLGSPEYWRWQIKLKLELEFADGICMSDHVWMYKNVHFFETHRYYTVHGRALWDDQKKANYNALQAVVKNSLM